MAKNRFISLEETLICTTQTISHLHCQYVMSNTCTSVHIVPIFGLCSYFFTRLAILLIFGFAGRRWLLLFWFKSCISFCSFTVCSLAPLHTSR